MTTLGSILKTMVRVTIDPRRLDEGAIRRAAEAIAGGGLVVVPTDTLYAIAANPFDECAVERVFLAKGRPDDRALPLIAADLTQVIEAIGPLTDAVHDLVTRYWPGPLTVLMTPPPALAHGVAAGTGRVGVRVPAHGVARALCAACGHPLTATSANLSGSAASADATTAVQGIESAIALTLDAGPTPGGPPSTIVDVSSGRATLVRSGAIPWKEIEAWVLDRQAGANARSSSGSSAAR